MIFQRENYGLLENVIWYVVIGFIYYFNYNDLSKSNTAKEFLLNSSYTVCCMSFLLMMDWHHKLLIVPLYLIWCFSCGAVAYALHRYDASLMDR